MQRQADQAVLAFRLWGPMAAWGAPGAVASDRPVLPRPGRGAILGLVAAALGLRRGDDEGHRDLGNSVLVAVSSHGRRRLAAEFRSAVETVPALTRREGLANPKGQIKTVIGVRGFTEDTLWRVFLASSPGARFSLTQIEAALTEPEFMLCLGRREHPLALPPDPELVRGNLTKALEAYPPVPRLPDNPDLRPLQHTLNGLEAFLHKDAPMDLSWDLGFPGAPDRGFTRTVQDDPMSRRHRCFMTRTEAFTRMASGTDTGVMDQAPAEADLDSFFDEADAV